MTVFKFLKSVCFPLFVGGAVLCVAAQYTWASIAFIACIVAFAVWDMSTQRSQHLRSRSFALALIPIIVLFTIAFYAQATLSVAITIGAITTVYTGLAIYYFDSKRSLSIGKNAAK